MINSEVDSGSTACKISREKCYVVSSQFRNVVHDREGDLRSRPTVSQFTLLASTKKGNKPDFHGAAGGDLAKELYDRFFVKVQELYEPEKVKNGVFQAMMQGARPSVATYTALLT